jgi:hypothetical protein
MPSRWEQFRELLVAKRAGEAGEGHQAGEGHPQQVKLSVSSYCAPSVEC